MPDSSPRSPAPVSPAPIRPGDGPVCQVALLTPPGRGAVATVLVAGPDSLDAVGPFFQTARGRTADSYPDYRILYGSWQRRSPESAGGRDPSTTRAEDVVVVRHGSERVEIHCHGGAQAAEAILRDLVTGGCQRTRGVDWLAEIQPSPIAGQATRYLVQAPTLRTAAILIDQAQGALDKALRTIVEQLGRQCTTAAKQGLVALLAHRRVGLHLVHPWRVALSGPPNVGKSSLINALVGYQRAIVYEQPGTTRDVVRAAAAFDGWPMQLLDTAGLRDSHDAVETEGIRRARQTARDADLVLLIQDAAQPMASDQHAPLVTDASRLIHICNRIDLVNSQAAEIGMAGCLATSALSGQGIPELMAAIVQRLVGPPPAAGAAVPFTRRQVATLQQALDSCERRQPAAAVAALERLSSHSIAPAGV